MRLDRYLCQFLDVESRNKAHQLIAARFVLVNSVVAQKPSMKIKEGDEVKTIAKLQFVSRGGKKLHAAITEASISLEGLDCIDVGASTGGFTDCMLQHGAKRVLALDVGRRQLHPKLQQDPRVLSMEQCDIRTFSNPPFHADFLAADLSFVSIVLCLESICAVMKENAKAVLLIKPQFEAGQLGYKRDYIPKGTLRQRVLTHCLTQIEKHLSISSHFPSPIAGAKKGNIEELILVEKKS